MKLTDIQVMRDMGIKVKILYIHSSGEYRPTKEFKNFWESYRGANRNNEKELAEFMKQKYIKNKIVSINITKVICDFVFTKWLKMNNINLTDEEMVIALDTVFALVE